MKDEIKKKLKALLLVIHEKELTSELMKLKQEFDKFETNQIGCHKLNEKIHHFHSDTAKEIYKKYNYSDNMEHFVVARAILDEIISIDDVPVECQEVILRTSKIIDEVNR